MKIVSEAMNGGMIPDKYGKRGELKDGFGNPCLSVPFKIENAPASTVSYALVLDDIDSVPVCGFVWIHWIAANIKATDIPEGASANADFVQGVNSCFGSNGRKNSVGYIGMAPPNVPHVYTLKVYALDCELDLEEGFFYNELMHAMDGHVLAVAEAPGTYNN